MRTLKRIGLLLLWLLACFIFIFYVWDMKANGWYYTWNTFLSLLALPVVIGFGFILYAIFAVAWGIITGGFPNENA